MKEKQTCILTIDTVVDDQHLMKSYQNKKLHYVLNLRYHSNRNIVLSKKFPKNFIFKAIYLLSARSHPNNSYNLKIIHIWAQDYNTSLKLRSTLN